MRRNRHFKVYAYDNRSNIIYYSGWRRLRREFLIKFTFCYIWARFISKMAKGFTVVVEDTRRM